MDTRHAEIYAKGFNDINEFLSKVMMVNLIQLCIGPYILLKNESHIFIIYYYILVIFQLGYINHIKSEAKTYYNMIMNKDS